jgi:hypothetical protein
VKVIVRSSSLNRQREKKSFKHKPSCMRWEYHQLNATRCTWWRSRPENEMLSGSLSPRPFLQKLRVLYDSLQIPS